MTCQSSFRSRSRLRCAFIAISLVLLSTASGLAANLYVAKSGADTPSCGTSGGYPCLTIQYTLNTIAHRNDFILISPGTYNETLTIAKNVRMSGINNHAVTLDAKQTGTAVTINGGVTAELEYMTITGGFYSTSEPADVAGGILNYGQLALFDVVLEGNSVEVGPAAFTPTAGGILNEGTLGIYSSTIAENSANGGCLTAGAVFNDSASLTMSYSAVTSNSVSLGSECDAGPGGIIGDTDGLYNGFGTAVIDTTFFSHNKISNNGNLTLSRSTISYASANGMDLYQPTIVVNSTIAHNGGSGINVVAGFYGYNGALDLSNSTIADNTGVGIAQPVLSGDIRNSILAGNGGGDCSGDLILDDYNIVQNTAGCGYIDGGHNLFGVSPRLSPLQYNGGPTQTLLPLQGSPAINAGTPSGCVDSNGNPITTDQRVLPRPRPEGGRCDIGAVEVQ